MTAIRAAAPVLEVDHSSSDGTGSRFATGKGLRLSVTVGVSPEGGVSSQTVQETKTALRELGLKDDLTT